MAPKELWALAKIVWEARVMAAWGPHGIHIIARTPWQPHAQHPLVAEDHLLCLAQVQAIMKELNQ